MVEYLLFYCFSVSMNSPRIGKNLELWKIHRRSLSFTFMTAPNRFVTYLVDALDLRGRTTAPQPVYWCPSGEQGSCRYESQRDGKSRPGTLKGRDGLAPRRQHTKDLGQGWSQSHPRGRLSLCVEVKCVFTCQYNFSSGDQKFLGILR